MSFLQSSDYTYSLQIQDCDRHNLKGLQLGPENGSWLELSDDHGKVLFKSSFEPGTVVPFAVNQEIAGDWLWISPWNQRLTLPQPGPMSLSTIVLVKKGDPCLLSDAIALKAMREKILDEMAPKTQALPTTSEEALLIVAKTYGVSPEAIDKAMRSIAPDPNDPYEQGLELLRQNKA